MKICYIVPNWRAMLTEQGGAATHILEMCGAWAELGHEVVVIAAGRPGDAAVDDRLRLHLVEPPGFLRLLDQRGDAPPPAEPGRQARPPAAREQRPAQRSAGSARPEPAEPPGDPGGPRGSLGGLRGNLGGLKVRSADGLRIVVDELWLGRLYRYARAVVAAERPDALYERYERGSRVGVRLAAHFGLPLVVEMNTSLTFEEEWRSPRSPAYVAWARRTEREIALGAARTVVVSRRLRGYLAGLGVPERKIAVMGNGADPGRFGSDPAAARRTRAELGLGDRTVIGFVGNFKPWIDFPLLVRAVRALLDAGHPAHLLLVGDGEVRDELESCVHAAGIAGHTTITGLVPAGRVAELLAVVDVAVAPYPPLDTFHFSPLKLFEYMAAGKAVVATRYPEIEDAVTHQVSGLLVEPGDLASLVDSLALLAADPALRGALGERARRSVIENHTWSAKAATVVGMYEQP